MVAYRLAEMAGEPDVDALMERLPYRVLRGWQTWWGVQNDEQEEHRKKAEHKATAKKWAKNPMGS